MSLTAAAKAKKVDRHNILLVHSNRACDLNFDLISIDIQILNVKFIFFNFCCSSTYKSNKWTIIMKIAAEQTKTRQSLLQPQIWLPSIWASSLKWWSGACKNQEGKKINLQRLFDSFCAPDSRKSNLSQICSLWSWCRQNDIKPRRICWF